MTVGYAKLVLDFYGNMELTSKRKMLDALTHELRKKCLLSIEEVEDFDDPERCVLGFSFISQDQLKAKGRMEHIISVIDSISPARALVSDQDFADL